MIFRKLIILPILTIFLQAENYEFYQLYKDIHIMGMGSANVGLGGSGTSVFYNPAGLSNINRKDGAEIKILNVSLSTNQNVLNIAQDGLDIQDIEDEDEKNLEVIRIIREHLGDNNHFEISNFSYLAKILKNKVAFSVGGLTNINLDFKTHRGFGSNGVMDIQGIAVGGAVFGASYNLSRWWNIGAGIKYLKYGAYQDTFTLGKIVQYKDDFDDYFLDEVVKEGSSVVFDFGAIYKYSKNISFGFSGLNIGGVGESHYLSYIPETYNLGVGYTKNYDKKFLKKIKAGFDFIDLTGNYPQSDFVKKTRLGVEATLKDTTMTTIKGSFGFYEGYYTAGINLRLTIVEISFVTYGEELGGYAGQDEDRRYLLNITIGW